MKTLAGRLIRLETMVAERRKRGQEFEGLQLSDSEWVALVGEMDFSHLIEINSRIPRKDGRVDLSILSDEELDFVIGCLERGEEYAKNA